LQNTQDLIPLLFIIGKMKNIGLLKNQSKNSLKSAALKFDTRKKTFISYNIIGNGKFEVYLFRNFYDGTVIINTLHQISIKNALNITYQKQRSGSANLTKVKWGCISQKKLIQLAELLYSKLDYLLTGDRSDRGNLNDTSLAKQLKELERFQAEDKEAVIRILDGMILKNRSQTIMTMDDAR
jgi:hypothetical protein